VNRKDSLVGIGLMLAGCSGAGTLGTALRPQEISAEGIRRRLAAGGRVDLPAGNFIIHDPPLTMPAGTIVRGAGIGKTVLRYTGKSHLIVDSDDVQISDLTLDGFLSPPASFSSFDQALVFLQGQRTKWLRVRIQHATSFGAFVYGGSPTVHYCQFDHNGRTNGQDSLGADHSVPPGVLYERNVFTNCHGNAIDNCSTTGIWRKNLVLSVAHKVGSLSGDIIADGGAKGIVIEQNRLRVGSIKVYGATPGCRIYHGEPISCKVIHNVIDVGKLCKSPDCNGLFVRRGNVHYGNVVNGVHVD
jgi:hypothetical protein